MSDKTTDRTGPHEDELIHRLFAEEYESMCRTAYYALGDYGLAETAVQETFVVALRFRDKLAASEKPVGWLYITLRNSIKHIRRDRAKILIHNVPLDSVPDQEAVSYDSYSILDNEIIDRADMKLLIEVYYKGYSIREVAEKEGISVGACKMRIKRAKDRLRRKLE